MCGIAGYIGKKIIKDTTLKNTINLMHTRGPDASDYKIFKSSNVNCYFLHSRLSIIDNNIRSNQPFIYKKLLMVFNGEIYNYLELKKKLIKKGYKFITKSDTEVLIKAYDFYGNKVFDELEGMWAFAIFNTKNYKLILSRDRFGEKPLYYKKTNHGIYFGSEIGYIKNLENKSLKLNIIKFRIFAKYGYNSVFLDDKTFFKKVNSLEPSKNLFLIKNKIKIKKYWFLEKLNEKNLNEKSNIKKIKKLLNLSVSKRLRTDVNNSLYLSGGIDSSGILSMCKKKTTTFSISNVTSKIYDEKNIIDKNVKFFDVKNYMHEVKKIDLLNEFKELSKKYQSPILNINSLPQYYLNKKIRKQGFKVVLSGIGADEIFAGYYDHFLHYLNSIKKSKNLFNKNLNLFKNLIVPKIRNSDFKDLSRINNPIYSRIRERNEFNIAVKKVRLKKI